MRCLILSNRCLLKSRFNERIIFTNRKWILVLIEMGTPGIGPEPPIGSFDDDLSPLMNLAAARRERFSSSRGDSIVPTAGREGAVIAPRSYKGRSMAVFTSGGDASGSFVAINQNFPV